MPVPLLSRNQEVLDFFYCDCAYRANLYTGFAAQTVIWPGDNGLVILKVINLCGTCVYAFLIALALVKIDCDLKHGFPPWLF